MFEKEFGKLKPILPLRESGNIKCANSARINWEEICPNIGEVYVAGNPPYLGSRNQENDQKKDMEDVFKKEYSSLDYISVWFIKGAEYINNNEKSKIAFVSTNSICQGEQVALLWPRVFDFGVEISFAYQSFKWENNAKNNAGVSVIIVGLSKSGTTKNKKIFINDKVVRATNINGYLADFNNVFVESRSKPLSDFPEMNFGSMPNDGGYLLLDKNEYTDLLRISPEAKKFIKKTLGGQEFINGTTRYCIWVEESDLDEAKKIPTLLDRFNKVYNFRIKSSRSVTKNLAEYNYRFGEVRYKKENSIIIPATSSENRSYIPMGFLDEDIVVTNSANSIYTNQIYIFGILSSAMHMVWVRAVGGKLEDRLRYSKNVIYNTFPFPKITEQQKEVITKQVYNILDEREKYPGKTLAELYDTKKMPYNLKQAHEFLDEVIDRIYRVKPFENDEERLAHLFKLYEEMVEKEKQESKK
jgi:ABC-type oligopeptide transport system ATPase subunit